MPATPKPNASPTEALRAARAAFERGALAAASRELVRAWTSLPSPRIAALAVRAGKRLPVRTLPSAIAAREAAWIALAATRNPSALPTLLGVDWPVHPRGAKARLAELVKFPPDPRIAEALVGLWHAKRYRSNASDPFWKSAFRTIARWGDPRPGELAKAAKGDITWYGIFESLGTLPGAVAIAAPIGRELAAIEAVLDRAEPAPASYDALFAAVYAEPDVDAPRAVLGDALLADGDPRGELIQLQLSGRHDAKIDARVRALLRDHGEKWVYGLGDNLRLCEFRRGLVAGVTVVTKLPSAKELARPAWRAIDELALLGVTPSPASFARFLEHPNLAGVRTLRNVPLGSLTAIKGARELTLLASAPLVALPATLRVRELTLVRELNEPPPPLDATFAWLARLPHVAALRAVELDHDESALVDAAAWLVGAAPPTLERLALNASPLGPEAWHLALSRAPGGKVAIVATWHGRLYGERAAEGLGTALARLPRGSLASITAQSAVKLEPAGRKQLERDLATGLRGHGLAVPKLATKPR